MKKYLFYFLLVSVSVFTFFACNKDETTEVTAIWSFARAKFTRFENNKLKFDSVTVKPFMYYNNLNRTVVFDTVAFRPYDLSFTEFGNINYISLLISRLEFKGSNLYYYYGNQTVPYDTNTYERKENNIILSYGVFKGTKKKYTDTIKVTGTQLVIPYYHGLYEADPYKTYNTNATIYFNK